mmetsp:Transcript_12413/g.35850  ORF Transcript_12413/g.35850 Transcript_12413/m.35850 type:complete len:228 (-) Transcript_12413:142-825(-)
MDTSAIAVGVPITSTSVSIGAPVVTGTPITHAASSPPPATAPPPAATAGPAPATVQPIDAIVCCGCGCALAGLAPACMPFCEAGGRGCGWEGRVSACSAPSCSAAACPAPACTPSPGMAVAARLQLCCTTTAFEFPPGAEVMPTLACCGCLTCPALGCCVRSVVLQPAQLAERRRLRRRRRWQRTIEHEVALGSFAAHAANLAVADGLREEVFRHRVRISTSTMVRL